MLKIFIAAFLTTVAAGCGGNSTEERKNGYSDAAKTPEDSLFQQVMDGHDEAMARMGKVSGYKKQVEQRLDSVEKIKGAGKKALLDSYSALRDKLKSAEDGMNKWMEQFQIDSAQDNTSKRIEYLTDEKMKVERVRDEIFSALDSAETILSEKK